MTHPRGRVASIALHPRKAPGPDSRGTVTPPRAPRHGSVTLGWRNGKEVNVERTHGCSLLRMVAAGSVLLGCTAAWAASPGPESGAATAGFTAVQTADSTLSPRTSLPASDPDRAAVPLQPGTRVRVHLAGEDGEREGVFLGVDETSLRILEDDVVVTLKRHTIRRIDAATASRGPTSRKRIAIGSLIGAGAGLSAGGIAAYLLAGGVSGDPDYNATPALLTGVAIGTVVGGAIAHATRGPGWTEVRIDRVQVSVLPTRGGGVRAALAIRF
jgi:hypothetical protein